jgi:hypothetical protein
VLLARHPAGSGIDGGPVLNALCACIFEGSAHTLGVSVNDLVDH